MFPLVVFSDLTVSTSLILTLPVLENVFLKQILHKQYQQTIANKFNQDLKIIISQLLEAQSQTLKGSNWDRMFNSFG